jgi:hypothetical protein
MNKHSIKFFKQFFSATQPLMEELITNVCEELGQSDKAEEMIAKFLTEDRQKFTKILNKKSSNNKRKKTAYSMFLADKSVLVMLKEKYPECNSGQADDKKQYLKLLNKKKGEYWRNEVQGTDLYKMYEKQAQEANSENKE